MPFALKIAFKTGLGNYAQPCNVHLRVMIPIEGMTCYEYSSNVFIPAPT